MKSIFRKIRVVYCRLFSFFFFNKYEKSVCKNLNYKGVLIINYFVQRMFGSSSQFPYSVHYTSSLLGNPANIKIEMNSISVLRSLAISGGCYITVQDGTTLSIGENTIWAYNVSIVTANHDFVDRDKYIKKNVKIGRNCWLAKGVSILPGVVLGDNVTVGANAVVTKSFPSNVVIGGVPAKIIKTIDT